MKKIFIIIIILCIAGIMLSAKPDWETAIYPTSTVAYGKVTIEGKPADEGDVVYSFVRGECRGAQPVRVADGIAYLTINIQGLENNEPVYFKLWDASEDTIYEVDYTTHTKPNHDIGYPPNTLPINAVKVPVLYFFPPEELVMHPYEVRQLDVRVYCNTVEPVTEMRVFGAENLEVIPDGFLVNISAPTDWKGEEEIEIELLNENREVINYGSIYILVE